MNRWGNDNANDMEKGDLGPRPNYTPEESEDSSLGEAAYEVMRSRVNQGESEDILPSPGLPHIADSDQS